MTEEIGAIGDIATGAVIARAVEPAGGEATADRSGHTHESACLNCATPLVGSHCHRCGQAAHVHRTIGAFFHDLLHGVFHFEGKIWRTLPMLAVHPGRLTREYIDGRRASYVSPIALFLFVVFLTFAVIQALGGPDSFDSDTFMPTVTIDGKEVPLTKAEAAARKALATREARRSAAVKAGRPVAEIDREIAELRTVLAESGRDLAKQQADDQVDVDADDPTGAWINRNWQKAKENPELLAYKLQAAAYKYSWALIPISVPFLWLMFAWRRRFGLYDHTVFVTYSLSFMLVLLLLGRVAISLGASWLVLAAAVIAPLHIYRQLRGTYDVSRLGGIVRTGLVSASALVALMIWMLVLVGLMLEG